MRSRSHRPWRIDLILRKVTEPYEGDQELDILYRKKVPEVEVKLPWYARFKNWIMKYVRRIQKS